MKYLSLIIILLLSCNAFSQRPVWFYDEFNDNAQYWNLEQNNDLTCSIKDSNLTVESNSKTELPSLLLKSIYLNTEKDFSISISVKFLKKNKDSYAGIVFGGKDRQNFFTFMTDAEGKYSIYKVFEGKRLSICEPSPFKNPLPDGFMKISLFSKDGKIFFSINNKEVYFIKKPLFMGLITGISFMGKETFLIDYFKIEQDNKINIPQNLLSGYKRENLGKSINSFHQEKVPVISHDGKTLYYAIQGIDTPFGSKDDDDIWISTLEKDSSWSKKRNAGFPLNNEGHNFVISVSPDNNTLLLNNTYTNKGKYKGIGFSMSQRRKNGWSVPKDVVVENYKNLSPYKEACLSPDGKVMILAIQTEKTFGDRDLYISTLKEDSTWSEPVNIGNTLNSIGIEMSPFIAADGITLYYSTNGFPGYGEHDAFMSKRLDDTWLNWSAPVNLGPEINSPGWDAYYTIPASGECAYFVSTQNSFGKEDIFRINLPDELKPKPIVLIYGKVLNSKTLNPLEAIITYRELESDKIIGTARSESETGSYAIALPSGKKYSFLAEKEKFASVNENIDVTNLGKYYELEKNLYLAPIESGQIVRLNNIFFDFDKSTLRPESYPELNRVIKMLDKNPTLKIEISGHTDNIGDNEYNKSLSERRAKAVKQYLVSKGISENRISAKGYGSEKPTTKNDTDEGRQLNRRVEFKITEI